MGDDITPQTIRDLRGRLGLTQSAFAALLGCSLMAVWHWENGSRSPRGLYAHAVRRLLDEHPPKTGD